MDATWCGRDPVPRLGYVEWPLTGPTPFREVWQRVVNKGSSLELLMLSVVGVAYNWSPSPSLPPHEAAAVAAARQLDVSGSMVAAWWRQRQRYWRQRDSATSAVSCHN